MGAGDDMESMMQRHMAPLPNAYARLTNPVPGDNASLERGEAIYAANCAACHGEEGWGDGPAAENLSPAPAPLAHTAQMLSDAYLFYRVSEGGGFAPFNSAMPPFKATLSEAERWDVINYLQALGSDGMMNGGPMTDGNMMNWMMAPVWILGWLLTLGVVVGIVLAVVWVVRQGKHPGKPEDTPLEILKRRYAQGEISKEQYQEMRQQLME
ncbi:MAG: hypothetical protein Fur0022_00820 [Anaerolineales bacterium]